MRNGIGQLPGLTMQSMGLQIFLIKKLTLSCLTPHWLQVNYRSLLHVILTHVPSGQTGCSSCPQKRKDIAMRKIKNNSRKLYNSLRKADAICMTVARYARNINREAEKALGHNSSWKQANENKNAYWSMKHKPEFN